jgi:hypothetical protein
MTPEFVSQDKNVLKIDALEFGINDSPESGTLYSNDDKAAAWRRTNTCFTPSLCHTLHTLLLPPPYALPIDDRCDGRGEPRRPGGGKGDGISGSAGGPWSSKVEGMSCSQLCGRHNLVAREPV